jgi:invasin B
MTTAVQNLTMSSFSRPVDQYLPADLLNADGMKKAVDISLAEVVGVLQRQSLSGANTNKADMLRVRSDAPLLRAPLPPEAAPVGPDGELVLPNSAAQFGHAANLLYLVTQMQSKMYDVSSDLLQSNIKMFREQRKAQNADYTATTKEIIERAEASKTATDAMGCAGKIIGGFILVASVALAAFSGGTSLIMAGVALAFMGVDFFVKKVTGTSITDRIITPLIDNVFTPIAKAVGYVITKALESAGVDANTAAIVGGALGAVVTAIAIVALAYFAGPVAMEAFSAFRGVVETVGTKLATQAAKSLAGKAGQTFIATAAKNGGKEMASSVAAQVAKMAKPVAAEIAEVAESAAAVKPALNHGEIVASRLRMGVAVGSVVNSGIQSAGSVYVGVQENAIHRSLAHQIELSADVDILKKVSNRAMDSWLATMKDLPNFLKIGLDAAQRETSSGMSILANTRLRSI